MADQKSKRYIPPVGFYYTLSVLNAKKRFNASTDVAFQEITGFSATMETTTINNGGENRFAYKVPSGPIKYDDLVLKRGLMIWYSPLAKWCRDQLEQGYNETIEPASICVQLLDAYDHKPLMAWTFQNAYPIKWEISNLAADKSEIVIETLTFAYSYFTTVPVTAKQSKYAKGVVDYKTIVKANTSKSDPTKKNTPKNIPTKKKSPKKEAPKYKITKQDGHTIKIEPEIIGPLNKKSPKKDPPKYKITKQDGHTTKIEPI